MKKRFYMSQNFKRKGEKVMEKKKYFCVVSMVYNNGKVTANIVDMQELEKKPENSSSSNSNCHIYVKWFEGYDAAQNYIEKAMCA